MRGVRISGLPTQMLPTTRETEVQRGAGLGQTRSKVFLPPFFSQQAASWRLSNLAPPLESGLPPRSNLTSSSTTPVPAPTRHILTPLGLALTIPVPRLPIFQRPSMHSGLLEPSLLVSPFVRLYIHFLVSCFLLCAPFARSKGRLLWTGPVWFSRCP